MVAETDRRMDLARLEFRLEDGWQKITEAAAKGQDTARWEDVWIRLLEDYERLYAGIEDVTR